MNIEKIRANVPEGATHYNERTETYYKQEGILYYWEGEWRKSWYAGAQFMIYTKPL